MKSSMGATTKGRQVIVFSALVFLLVTILRVVSVVRHGPQVQPIAGTRSVRVKTAPPEGWHPIHVFFGNRSALLEGSMLNATWYSQAAQDQIVADLLGVNGGDRYFIDLAANHARHFSNTLALEKRGWDGLCIEPNPTYWYGLSHRKCTVVGALVGRKVDRVKVSFRGAFGGIVGYMSNADATRYKAPSAPTEMRYTVPLIEVFEQFEVPNVVDYLSLDVEGAEYLIMKDFPFDKYTMRLMTVERPSNDLKKLFGQHGYVFLKTISKFGETLWAHNSTGITPESLENITP